MLEDQACKQEKPKLEDQNSGLQYTSFATLFVVLCLALSRGELFSWNYSQQDTIYFDQNIDS